MKRRIVNIGSWQRDRIGRWRRSVCRYANPNVRLFSFPVDTAAAEHSQAYEAARYERLKINFRMCSILNRNSGIRNGCVGLITVIGIDLPPNLVALADEVIE
jgi:hypothetical protein